MYFIQKFSIGAGNGLAPNKRQAIARINYDPVNSDLDELNIRNIYCRTCRPIIHVYWFFIRYYLNNLVTTNIFIARNNNPLFNVFQLYTHLTSRATVNGNSKMEDLLPCIWSWHFNCFSSRNTVSEVSQAPTWVVGSSWYIVLKGVEYEGAGILTVVARNNTITIYHRIIAWLKMYAALTVLSPCIYNIYVNTRIFVVDIRIRLERCDDVANFPATGSTPSFWKLYSHWPQGLRQRHIATQCYQWYSISY